MGRQKPVTDRLTDGTPKTTGSVEGRCFMRHLWWSEVFLPLARQNRAELLELCRKSPHARKVGEITELIARQNAALDAVVQEEGVEMVYKLAGAEDHFLWMTLDQCRQEPSCKTEDTRLDWRDRFYELQRLCQSLARLGQDMTYLTLEQIESEASAEPFRWLP
jgi:hypothetical protein